MSSQVGDTVDPELKDLPETEFCVAKFRRNPGDRRCFEHPSFSRTIKLACGCTVPRRCLHAPGKREDSTGTIFRGFFVRSTSCSEASRPGMGRDDIPPASTESRPTSQPAVAHDSLARKSRSGTTESKRSKADKRTRNDTARLIQHAVANGPLSISELPSDPSPSCLCSTGRFRRADRIESDGYATSHTNQSA